MAISFTVCAVSVSPPSIAPTDVVPSTGVHTQDGTRTRRRGCLHAAHPAVDDPAPGSSHLLFQTTLGIAAVVGEGPWEAELRWT